MGSREERAVPSSTPPAPKCPGLPHYNKKPTKKACNDAVKSVFSSGCSTFLKFAGGGVLCSAIDSGYRGICTASIRKTLEVDTKIIVCDEGVHSEYECKKHKKYRYATVKEVVPGKAIKILEQAKKAAEQFSVFKAIKKKVQK